MDVCNYDNYKNIFIKVKEQYLWKNKYGQEILKIPLNPPFAKGEL